MTAAKRLDGYFWGGVLVLAGLVFVGESMEMLPEIANATTWSWIFLGAGVLSLVLNLISYSSESYENPTGWDWFWGGLFFVIGIGGFTTVNISWPVIILLVGLGTLAKAILRRD